MSKLHISSTTRIHLNTLMGKARGGGGYDTISSGQVKGPTNGPVRSQPYGRANPHLLIPLFLEDWSRRGVMVGHETRTNISPVKKIREDRWRAPSWKTSGTELATLSACIIHRRQSRPAATPMAPKSSPLPHHHHRSRKTHLPLGA